MFLYRHRGKLTIPLCKSCVHEEIPKKLLDKSHRCSHTPEQRQLRGTWCTPELVTAVEVGYRIVKFDEVWHFPPEQRVKGLFADYVNTWLKIKQESAGTPAGPPHPKPKHTTSHNTNRKKTSTSIQLSMLKIRYAKPPPNSHSTASWKNSAKIFTNPPPK